MQSKWTPALLTFIFPFFSYYDFTFAGFKKTEEKEIPVFSSGREVEKIWES